MLRAVIVFGLVAVASLTVAGTAWAKGVSSATIEGPGLKDPVVIEETRHGGNLSPFVKASGFWQLLYGGDGSSEGWLLAELPAGDLGPVYRVTWYLGDDPYPAASDVYPLAPGGPLVHVEEGKTGGYFGIDVVPGGWYAAEPILIDLMSGYGVPVVPSESITRSAAESVAGTGTPVAAPKEVPAGAVTASPPLRQSSIPVIAIVIVVLGIVVVGSRMRASGRRPRRPGAP